MRAFLGSLLILLVCVALTILGIAYGYPNHPYLVGTVMILTACYSIHLHQRVYVEPDMLDTAKRDAARLLCKMKAREFLSAAHFPALWGVVIGMGAAVGARYTWPIDLKQCLMVFGAVFALTFVGILTKDRLMNGSWRASIS